MPWESWGSFWVTLLRRWTMGVPYLACRNCNPTQKWMDTLNAVNLQLVINSLSYLTAPLLICTDVQDVKTDFKELSEKNHETNSSLTLAVIIYFLADSLGCNPSRASSFFSAAEFDQDGGTMRGTINVIYSHHHGCCGNPTFNTLTSAKALCIPVACLLMHIGISTHTVHLWKHTQRPC